MKKNMLYKKSEKLLNNWKQVKREKLVSIIYQSGGG